MRGECFLVLKDLPALLLNMTPQCALAGWLSWLERRPIHQKVLGSVSGQGTDLGCRFGPR